MQMSSVHEHAKPRMAQVAELFVAYASDAHLVCFYVLHVLDRAGMGCNHHDPCIVVLSTFPVLLTTATLLQQP